MNKGYTKTAISTLILAQTCADCFESCITMYYMIPSARRKFDAESKVLQGFSSQRFHQNGHIYSYSGSNLRRALWIMYHHVIHDSKRSTQVWCRIQGFAKVFVTIRDAGSTIIDACSTAQKYVLVKYTFLSQKFANTLSVLTLTDICRSLLARQLIVGWWAMILYFGHDISWF